MDLVKPIHSEMRTIVVQIELRRAFSNITRLGFLETEHFFLRNGYSA